LRRDGETQLLPVGTDRKGGGDKLVKKQTVEVFMQIDIIVAETLQIKK
jgi:hypothetical protein